MFTEFRMVLPDSLLPTNETSSTYLKKVRNENKYQNFNIVGRNVYIPKGLSTIIIKMGNSNVKYECITILSRNICSTIDETINNKINIGMYIFFVY